MSPKVRDWLIGSLICLVQLINGVMDYRLEEPARSFSLYLIPVVAAALFFGYVESLLFAAGTAILYSIAEIHSRTFRPFTEITDLAFLFCLTVLLNKLMAEHRLLRQMAVHDPLTGLYDRAFLFKQIEREIRHAHRYGRPLSLLMIDIDHFKDYNDTYGHQQGDIVLREVAHILRKVRSTDTVGRYGGEEFAIILPETNLAQARIVAERLRKNVSESTTSNQSIMGTIHVSIGVATCLPRIRSAEALVENADSALYEAKRQGRNRVVLYILGMEGKPKEVIPARRASDREPVNELDGQRVGSNRRSNDPCGSSSVKSHTDTSPPS